MTGQAFRNYAAAHPQVQGSPYWRQGYVKIYTAPAPPRPYVVQMFRYRPPPPVTQMAFARGLSSSVLAAAQRATQVSAVRRPAYRPPPFVASPPFRSFTPSPRPTIAYRPPVYRPPVFQRPPLLANRPRPFVPTPHVAPQPIRFSPAPAPARADRFAYRSAGAQRRDRWSSETARRPSSITPRRDAHARPTAAAVDRGVSEDHDLFRDLVTANRSRTDPTTPDVAQQLRSRWGFNVQVRASPDVTLDNAQDALDIAGLYPGPGDFLDVINGALSAMRGRFSDAAIRFGAAVPFLGIGATVGKWARKTAWAEAKQLAKVGAMQGPRRSVKLRQLLSNARALSASEQQAADAALRHFRATGDAKRAGSIYHREAGLAGPGQRVDFTRPGYQKEVKTHFVPAENWQAHAVEQQSQAYSFEKQLLDVKLGRTRLVPLRLVEHVYIDPVTGIARKVAY